MKLVNEFEELTLERRAFGSSSPDSFRAGPMSATEALGHNPTTALQQARVRSNRLSPAGHIKVLFLECSSPDIFAWASTSRGKHHEINLSCSNRGFS